MRILLVFLLLCSLAGNAQEAPFASEIQAFTRQDSEQPPPKRPILFVGSSSFRLWQNLQQDFAGKPVLNRGFGGASIPDVVRYANETIFRYNPSRIIFYCGENDLADSDTVSAQTVVNRFTALFTQIRSKLPGVPFTFVSIKPSPSRMHLMHKMAAANGAIRAFLQQHPQTAFVDVFTPMLNDAGRPRPELFVSDSLHMNRQGYVLWKGLLQRQVR
ncbi:GDSL-type esterase/lipase family protein [Paracnuella aquatica]|uniref:GDSL-type esterase/lipase family protein n=1 Tax=Paracnuella aquatica TaxID=2268757 RepID=UPI000DEF2A04|nr:GDSL-type esterase/lipase family protein [Paracnuella aquatica]RPD46032.1 G-D-S-L family lipolytic protein [Paracnuella aquatica]